jgi:Flp pilus assembly protein TadD
LLQGGAYAIRSTQFELDHPADELLKMRAAAEKAIQLDRLLAEAYDALAIAQARDSQWEQAEKNFRRAIELDPNGARVRISDVCQPHPDQRPDPDTRA